MNLISEQKHIHRFYDIIEGVGRPMLPIQGYGKMPLLTLDEAVEPLITIVPEVKYMAWIVKQNCKNPLDNLLSDESASIMLYTLEWQPRDKSFYKILNDTLRTENCDLLKPWFSYLKLFITALSKIPSKHCLLHRGIKKDISGDYPRGKIFIWWGFSSCTSSIHTLESETFLGKNGTRTLFVIDCHSGKNIHQHSMFRNEDEVLLLAARQFLVVSCMNVGNSLSMIHIKEIDPPFPLLEPLLTSNVSTSVKSLPSTSSMKVHSYGPYHNEKLEHTIRSAQSQKLDLSGHELNDQDIEIVIKQGIIGKQCLILDLMNTNITQYGVSLLANTLLGNKHLEELNISYNSISDFGVRCLSSTINSSILKHVDLSENDITDEGAKYLAEMLKTNTNLRRLILSENQIGDNGVNVLATSLETGNTSLEVLDLSANRRITDESIDPLVSMIKRTQSLKKLDLRHNNISENGETRLQTEKRLRKDFDLWLSHFL